MGAMRDLRVRDERTQQMFQPLKETVTLLKHYNVPIKDETLNHLDEGPSAWKALDKKKKQRIEALNAKIIAEQLEVRRRSDAFQKNVDAFSEHFQGAAPFHVKVCCCTLPLSVYETSSFYVWSIRLGARMILCALLTLLGAVLELGLDVSVARACGEFFFPFCPCAPNTVPCMRASF
jgi:hypothetical protein